MFGIKEHIIFPECELDKVDKIRGLDITIVTSSKTREGTFQLLKEFNFPITEKSEVTWQKQVIKKPKRIKMANRYEKKRAKLKKIIGE